MAKERAAELDIENMSIDEVCEAMNKKYGMNTIIRASEAKGTEIQYISTGSYALDFGLGGGFPKNRIIELRGPFSSFKSTISMFTIRNFQRQHEDGICILIDLEKSFDRRYAIAIGIDLDRLYIVNPDSGEQAINALDDLMRVKEDTLVILDSIAALIPSAEIVSEAEQQHMGLQARLVNKMMRIATARLKRNMYDDDAPSMTVVCLNQLRMKIGVMFGNPETTPGGEGKNFFYSTIVRVSSTPSNVIKKEEVRNGITHTVLYGQTVEFKVIKNKCGGPQHEQGEFTFHYKDNDDNRKNTFNNLEALFHYGAFNDVITYDGNRGYVYGKLAAKKEAHFIKLLRKNPSAQIELYNKILATLRPKDKPKALSSAPVKKLKLFA